MFLYREQLATHMCRSANVGGAQRRMVSTGAAHAVPPGADGGTAGIVAGGPRFGPVAHAFALAVWIYIGQVSTLFSI